MQIFDNRVNSIFEDIIRQSMGIKMLLNGFENEKNEKKFLKVEKLKKKEFLKN